MTLTPVVIAISSRALFDLDESNRVFEQEGLAAYADYQRQHEDEILSPGVAFPLIRRLLDIGTETGLVEVVLMSRNDAMTGLRVFNSIAAYQLGITRAVFTAGRPTAPYLKAFDVSLFLSASGDDVTAALAAGCPSATILTGIDYQDDDAAEVRIAFDGDAVLFGDEAEQIFRHQGLTAFQHSEAHLAHTPLADGPFRPFLEGLNRLQQTPAGRRIRVALITARGAPAHKRAIMTLRAWGVNVNEAFFQGGRDKGNVLEVYRPHIFFDDLVTNTDAAAKIVPTGHVPFGVNNSQIGRAHV